MAKYFCYVSDNKVDQLISQIDEHAIDSITADELVEKQKSVNPGIGKVLSFLTIGASFGK